MEKYKFKAFILLMALVVSIGNLVFSAEDPNKATNHYNQSFQKGTGTPVWQILNINNIWTWMRADGQQNHSPTADDGAYFPRGTKWVIYQDGFVWGGKAFLDEALTQPAPIHAEPIRIGGQTYNIGTRAGRIIGSGATAVAADPAAADVRIYRIRRDYFTMKVEELKRDAAESYEIPIDNVSSAQMAAITAQYALDWNEWPVAYGAPYIERNGIAGYQKPPAFSTNFTVDSLIAHNYDEPGLAGADPNSPADQVIWTVINDLDRSATLGLFGSEPLGLEAQITLWGYKRTDAMGNLYFKKIKFTNKGGVDIGGGTKGSFYIDSMFIAQWSDPDLGAFGDDLCGTDSVLSLGFVYNGLPVDAEFNKFKLPPPAVGYDFLQGPLVPGLPSDSGVFNLRRVYGKKNLPLTSFAYFSAGSGISDPPFTREGGLRWWRMLQGFVPDASTATWRLYPHPTGMTLTKFPLSGEPTTRSGFIDGLGTAWSLAPGDRRIVLNSGPFRLNPGDIQEIVVGTVAGLGSDRLSSVSVMKFNDRFVQNTYNALFVVPKPPKAPKVTVAELDGQVILEWGSDQTAVNSTEIPVNFPGGYKFEGYNVYQLPSRSSSLSEGKRIATYDLTTDPTVILNEDFDVASGQILLKPIQFGTNSGITRNFNFTRDYVKDIDKIYNGQEYYLVVTAYSYSTVTGYLPTSLESEPTVLTVRPQSGVGVKYTGVHGKLAPATSVGAFNDGFVNALIINPKVTTGAEYEVSFTPIPTNPTKMQWSLKNLSNNVVHGPFKNLGAALGGNIYEYPIIDGIFWEVAGPPSEVKDFKRIGEIAKSDSVRIHGGMTTTSGLTGPYWVGEGGSGIFGGVSTSRAKAADMKNVIIVFDETVSPAQRMAYRYVRAGQNAKADPRYTDPPYGRTTYTTSSWGYCDTAVVPFRAFRYDPEAGITTPVQLAVGFSENNVAGCWVDGRFGPTNGTASLAEGGREFLIVFNKPYDATMMQDEYKYNILGTAASPYGAEGWHDATFVYWFRSTKLYSIAALAAGDEVPKIWKNGDSLLTKANHVLSTAVKFIVKSPNIISNDELLKQDVAKIGVYPNPYYAYNPAETNRFVRFVTFNKLPTKATIRIFNVAGILVRTIQKDDPSQFLRWDLNNEDNFPVASGMYIVHVDLPDIGQSKVLKLAIIQEQEVPEVF